MSSVTGAASPQGVGKATGRLFAERGATVATLDLDMAATKSAAEDLGPNHAKLACNVLDQAAYVGEGHQGVPLGMATIATVLYSRHLRFDPADPLWLDRDRVVLSNGHDSMLLYALLYLSGNAKITIDAIRTFRELGSHCAGHPKIDHAADIEVNTGPLGQGTANAVGMAVAEARLAVEFGNDLVDHCVRAFVGDSCLQDGIGQEAISLAGHLGLGKLTFLWGDNCIIDDGSTMLSINEDMPARFRPANWHGQRHGRARGRRSGERHLPCVLRLRASRHAALMGLPSIFVFSHDPIWSAATTPHISRWRYSPPFGPCRTC
jgi:transketolase